MKYQYIYLTLSLVCSSNLFVYGKSLYSEGSISMNPRSISGDFKRWNDNVFAPYYYTDTRKTVNITELVTNANQKYFTYCFMNAVNKDGTETPSWNKSNTYDNGKYDSEIETIRKNGGDIIISFGGSGGRELATVIEDEDELYNAYKSVIDYYKLSWIDLDIEGDVLKLNENANINRNKVMLRLKNEYPNLILAYCLGAEHTTGISNAGIKVLKHAKKIGLQVDVVNVMAMDFSRKETPDGDTKMGQYAIDTAKVAYEQVNEIGFKNTKIGITPMIGKNDHIQQIFTLNNAMEVLEFSQNNEWVRLLSFWALNRDNGDGGDTDETSNKYSSIEQEEFAFTNIFKNFNSNNSNSNPTTITVSPTPNLTQIPTQYSTLSSTSKTSQTVTKYTRSTWKPTSKPTPNTTMNPISNPTPKSTNGRCGPGFGYCPNGKCCSKYGYCGTTNPYCGKGCQPKYGLCEM